MKHKNFLLLLSASAADKPAMQAIDRNIKTLIDATAKPLWFDSTHAGYFISSPSVARLIWAMALKDLPPAKTENLRDVLILEIGDDQAARSDSKAGAWLNSHGVSRKFG